MEVSQKPFDMKTLDEMRVGSLLNMIFSQSRVIMTLLQMTDGAAGEAARQLLLRAADSIVWLSCSCSEELNKICGSHDQA